MQHFSKMINGVNYTLYACSWETCAAWGHAAELHADGVKISEAKIRYYNRTWESYQYQTTLKASVSKAFNRVALELFQAERARTGRRSLSRDTKAAILAADPEYNNLQQLYKSM